MKWLDYVLIFAIVSGAIWAALYVVKCFWEVANEICVQCDGTGNRQVEGVVGSHKVKCPACAGTGHRSAKR